MRKSILTVCAILLAFGAGAARAQEADTLAPAADPAAAPAEEQVPANEQAPAANEPAAEAQPAHDWEFALSATDKAPGASATVMVDEADQGSSFVIVANGLPEVNTLDEDTRDVNAYTVWVVPGKDRVAESTLAGTLSLEPDGTGRLEATTDLDTFGIIVTATPDGAPAAIGGVPVLTGIPVDAQAAAETAGAEVAEEAAETADDVADEMAEQDPDQAADVADEVSEGVSEVQEEAAEAAAEAPDAVDAAEDAAQQAADDAIPPAEEDSDSQR